ncbi:MAG TPA: precorrin-3B C(17)-methyltransferase [Dongiaceae bacterium]|nr:precorrin-3B C(17)-methyltransferase [Dongiaceae bacterium]
MSAPAPAILILGQGSVAAARKAQRALDGAVLYGLAERVTDADRNFEDFGGTIRRLFQEDTPIIAFCAAGIVIRALASHLQNKRAEPPVLAIAEDGSAVVPLLGGLRGVNALARRIGDALGTTPAITTTGEVRFGATLESPPSGYEIGNPGASKRFMSDLLAGEKVKLSGDAPWLRETRLPFDPAGNLTITVTPQAREATAGELVIHPRSIVVAVAGGAEDLSQQVSDALAARGLSPKAVGVVVAADGDAARPEIHAMAKSLGRPLRFLPDVAALSLSNLAEAPIRTGVVTIAIVTGPVDATTIGRARGRLAVVGLGPGAAEWMAPEVRRALDHAQDILGYETYVRMAGPFSAEQVIHASDNREELDRARHALSLAASGRSVVVVSSGDPGIFAMAAAVLEALEGSEDPAWHGVELVVMPGISAAQGAAARAGAPLGHDFCILSLSDNLKPWSVIEDRLDHAAAADLVLAFYNPISKARPWQLGRALEIVRAHRKPETPVVLGRDVGRPGESLRVVPLGELKPDDVDMRTVVIVGSSTTRTFAKADGSTWVYTPRWYEAGPQDS